MSQGIAAVRINEDKLYVEPARLFGVMSRVKG